jgi:hypothetical protein
MNSLPLLISRLKCSPKYHEALLLYNGTDWEDKITYVYGTKYCYPKTLWKGDYAELVLMSWCENQKFDYYVNYGAVYTRILKGELLYTTNKTKTINTINKNVYLYSPPLSIMNMYAFKNTASLHLFYQSDMK